MTAVEWFRRRPSRLVLAAVVTITSLLMYDYARASSADRAAPRFSGTELTRGLVFMEGEAAPYIWGSQLLAEFAPHIEKPVPHEAELFALLTSDAEVASSFARDMQSGSPVRVARALKGLGMRVQDALAKIHGADKIAELNRAGAEFVAQSRRLLGSPDFSGGTALRDFADPAASGGWNGDEVSRPRVPDLISQHLLLFFRSSNIFVDFNVFATFDTAVKTFVLGVLGVALAAIVILFVFLFVIIPPVPEGRHSEATERFLNEEFVARLANDLDAT